MSHVSNMPSFTGFYRPLGVMHLVVILWYLWTEPQNENAQELMLYHFNSASKFVSGDFRSQTLECRMSDVGCDARPRFEDVARAQLPKFPWGRRSAQCGESFSHETAKHMVGVLCFVCLKTPRKKYIMIWIVLICYEYLWVSMSHEYWVFMRDLSVLSVWKRYVPFPSTSGQEAKELSESQPEPPTRQEGEEEGSLRNCWQFGRNKIDQKHTRNFGTVGCHWGSCPSRQCYRLAAEFFLDSFYWMTLVTCIFTAVMFIMFMIWWMYISSSYLASSCIFLHHVNHALLI